MAIPTGWRTVDWAPNQSVYAYNPNNFDEFQVASTYNSPYGYSGTLPGTVGSDLGNYYDEQFNYTMNQPGVQSDWDFLNQQFNAGYHAAPAEGFMSKLLQAITMAAPAAILSYAGGPLGTAAGIGSMAGGAIGGGIGGGLMGATKVKGSDYTPVLTGAGMGAVGGAASGYLSGADILPTDVGGGGIESGYGFGGQIDSGSNLYSGLVDSGYTMNMNDPGLSDGAYDYASLIGEETIGLPSEPPAESPLSTAAERGVLGQTGDAVTGGAKWLWDKATDNPMLTLGSIGMLSNYLGGAQGEQAAQNTQQANQASNNAAAQANQQWWQQNAFPNQSLVNAKQAMAGSDLSSRLAEAKRRYMEDAARRGLRGGSLAGGLAGLERSTMKDYATLANQLIQFQNTPQFAPSGTNVIPAQQQLVPSAMGNMYNNLGSTAGTLAGYYAYRNLMGNQNNGMTMSYT